MTSFADSRTGNPEPQKKTQTVTEFTRGIKSLLVANFSSVRVLGEISGYKQAASGHVYFSLKDEHALVNCVMWRATAARLKGRIEDGQEVVAAGKLDLYEPRGQYNLVVSRIEPHGKGLLQKQFELLKEKLLKEGLFDAGHKQPIPYLPGVIGVVTSPTGAAFRDIITTLRRRFDNTKVILYPARVQGEGAGKEVAAGIECFNRQYGKVMDVMIVGRGGGSLEDLWAFNEEVVARAVFASRIPIVSAVGHEVDFSIADFVADLRAATPTAAAELAVPDKRELLEALDRHQDILAGKLRGLAGLARARVNAIRDSYGFCSMPDRIQGAYQVLDDVADRLSEAMVERVRTGKERLNLGAARLRELSPLNVLSRGYAVIS
ncbi:exodeoxyribonuclease VII large subunit, partial [Planctomycetota bacterium]